MTAPVQARGLRPGCPAISGHGTSISAALFTLVADDCGPGPGGQETLTDVFGYYQAPGQDSEDLIHVDGFDIPAGSPVALLAHQVAASRRRTRTAGEHLRAAITTCACTGACPAFDGVVMLNAIEEAASQPLRRRLRNLIVATGPPQRTRTGKPG